MLSLWHDATSPVHRCPAGAKLALLAVAGGALFLVSDLRVLAGLLVVVLAGYLLARVPWRLALRQVSAALPVAAAILVAQVWVAGWESAAVVLTRLLTLLLLAGLVTLTTRAEALVDAVETALGPLRPLGVRPERVGMVAMMTIRFVPVIAEQAAAVRAARRARGVEHGLVFVVPLLIRTLRMADQLAQALDARGVDADSGREPRAHP
jgi:biotin transport system permease protein